MSEILVELPGGEGLIRSDDERFDYCLAPDVKSGLGQPVGYQDPYAPGWMDLGDQRALVGGLLPPGAVSAEFVDDRGARVAAAVGNGAYAAVIERSNQMQDGPIVCCRDGVGDPVRRPWAAAYPSVRVLDAEDPCPACGAVDYDEYTPFEQWRGGRGSKIDGTHEPSPIVSCRVCGHEEREPGFVTLRPTQDDEDEDEATRARRIARARAAQERRMWLRNSEALLTAGFPIYRAAGRPVRIGGHGSHDGRLTEVTVDHDETAAASIWMGARPNLRVTTQHSDYHLDLLSQARHQLTFWIRQVAPEGRSAMSHAAATLRQRARARERHAVVLNAAQSEQTFMIDGEAMAAVMLTGPGDHWLAAGRHGELTILIAADDVDPGSLQLEPITAADLLGPEPSP